MSRTGLRLATATPALAALRPAHEHTRSEHARHARTMRARLASRAHALMRQHALTRQMLEWLLESLATGRPSAGSPLAHPARTSSAMRLPPPLRARHMRHPHAMPAIHHRRCTVRRDMMTIETKTNDTMKKTDNTMDDASECVSARACDSHAPWRMRTHDAKHVLSKAKPLFKIRVRLRPQMAAVDL